MDQPVFTSGVYYRDPKTALTWLEHAFGFEITMAIDGPPEAPQYCHYEMSVQGRGRVMIGGEWNDTARSPSGLGGVNTQSVHVQLLAGLDEHCAHARANGAVIVHEPEDQFYGDRVYRARDLEGHDWAFAMKVRDVTLAEAEAALGQSIIATNWP